MIVTEGATNVSVPFYFVDDVGGTNPGEPTTGLLFSDIETGGSASYQRQGEARVDFSLITLASASAAHADGGFILVDDTEMPGVYRCDIPDAAVAAGVDFVIIYLRAASGNNTITRPLKIDLNDLTKRLDRNADLVESQRGSHTWQGNYYYVDPVNGDTHASGNRGGRADPYKTIQDCHDNAVTDNNHDVIFLVSGAASGATTHTVAAITTISKNYVFIRGPGRNFIITRTGSGDTLAITGDGVEVSGVRIGTAATGSGDGIDITDADFARIHHCWFLATQGDGIHVLRGSNCQIHDNDFDGTGVAGSGDGIHIVGTGGSSNGNSIFNNEMHGTLSDAILIEQGTTNDTLIYHNDIHDAGGWGINIGASSTRAVIYDNTLGNNSSGDITDGGTSSIVKNNNAWLYSTTEGRSLDVTSTGAAGIDWANVENPSTAVDLSQTDIQLCDTVTEVTLAKGGYTGGAVFLDTNKSNTNTVTHIDGVEHNPVSTLAAAITIAGNINSQRLNLAPGSSITLTQGHDNWVFDACHSIIALGGQSINNAIFYGAVITGNDDGSNSSHVQYFDCVIGTNTLGQFVMTRCYFTATLTLAQAGSYFVHQCFSGVAGTSTPTLDFGVGLNSSNVNMRDYSGGIEIQNMGAGTGSYNLSLEGNGQIVINANCSATSTIAVRGNFTRSGDATAIAAIVWSDKARIDVDKIADHVRRRTQANVEASSDGDALSLGSQYGAIQQMQEASTGGTSTLTVKKTDGSTTLGTKALVTDAAADPVTGVS